MLNINKKTINVLFHKTIIHHTLFRFATQAENFTLFLNRHFVLSDKLCFLVQISSGYVAIQRQKNRYFPKDFQKSWDEFHLRANILFLLFNIHKKIFVL